MEPTVLPRVLCVDDEPNVLEALVRQLRRRFTVSTAGGGAAGLDLLAREEPFAVVVSDMRMPGMDGAAFLARVREQAPDTVRILLTGHADLAAAAAAVNDGQIFRLLTKPCPPTDLAQALNAAVEQHRVITVERVLLEETLRGCVKALTDILALANPAAFGRATRAQQRVSGLATKLDVPDRWQLDVAAMLSQIGCVTLPPETADKLYHGQSLAPAEQEMADRLPDVAGTLLGSIPRLEEVRNVLVYQAKHYDGAGTPRDAVCGADIPWGARALKLVVDYDVLEAQGVGSDLALATMRGRDGWYDPQLLDAFGELVGQRVRSTEVRELRLRDLRPGMVFAQDVVSRAGMLLIARGQEITPGIMERLRNFAEKAGVQEPVRVVITVVVDAETTEPEAGSVTRSAAR
ncbi:MAG: response regulator [Candidatus Binatia bacterium]